jgi:anti-sigma28 factor (negative regulator of flagellin synthesis)
MATLTLEAVMDTAKIERIRREVAKGTYLTEEKFDAAI